MKRIGNTIINFISSLFLSGLLTLAPIALTVLIFTATFRLVTSWVQPISHLKPAFLANFPHAELLLTILFIFAIGALIRLLILKPLIHALENLVFKLPLVRTVYSGIKQLVNAFGSQDQLSFKQVVCVEFPRTGVYSIGFMTGEVPVELSPTPHDNTRFFNVFIPHTPNPTGGYLIMVPEHMLITSKLTRHEAMSLIISGGIIQPERFSQR